MIMSAKPVCRFSITAACLIYLSGCSVLDQIELGGSPRAYDPSKVYLKDEFVTLKRHEDVDRYVCLSGPLQCDGFGQIWDCSCFQ